MRDRVRKPRRRSRRLVSFLAFGVLLLAAWVLATNTIFGPADTADNQAAPEPAAIVEAAPDSNLSNVRKADSIEKIAPARAPSDVAAVEVPAPANATADEKSVSAPLEGVEVAAVSPFMGGTETLLSPTLVSRSVEPAPEAPDILVPLPPSRPRIVAIPLPRPRPAIAAPVTAGREITEFETGRQQVYRQQVFRQQVY
jgi:hypothetical protein